MSRVSPLLLRSALALGVTALTAVPGRAAVTACLTDGQNPLRRVWVEHFFDNRMTGTNGCVTFPNDNGPIDVRVHAHNPVVRMDDGNAAAIAVSQVVTLRDGATVAIPDQAEFWALGEQFRTAYNVGLREFSPWAAEFPAASVRTSDNIIRVTWPDSSVAERAFTEPSALGTLFPLIHLKAGDETDPSVIAHELGHALHFDRLSLDKRVEAGTRFLNFLATDAEKFHCFERRTDPTVAYLEAFGQFAETYRLTTRANAASGPVRHADFFQEAEALEPSLFAPNPMCEDREPGPMLGDDVEGAVFMTLFYDFARQVGLDFVVSTYVSCQSLDIREYAACLRDDPNVPGSTFEKLVAAGANYGIIFTNTGLEIAGAVESGDRYGSAVAHGDFNGDGYADLAIGVPRENVGDVTNAGAVSVLYGTRSGLIVARDQFWSQGTSGVPGDNEAGDMFGSALAAGDFNHDGSDDLAIGIPG